MNTNTHRNLRRILTGSISAACTLAAIFATQPAHAVTATWNAGTAVSTDGLWSTATNWTLDTAPLNGDDLVFAGTDNQTNSNDIIPLTSIASLALSNANWNITLGTLSIGAGGVTANGTSTLGGTLTLGAAQTWSNSANSADTLTFGGTLDAATFGLTVDGAGNTSFLNLISNGAALTKSGAGELGLAGNNAFTSATINGGTITGGMVTLSGGATALTSSATSAVNSDVTISTAAGTITSNAGTLSLGGTLNAGSLALTFDGAGATTLSNAITSGTTLTKSGAGILTLSGTNDFTSATINGGTITGGTVTLSGGATALTSSATSAVNSNVTMTTAGTITSNAGTLTLGGTLDAGGFALTFDGAGNTIVSNAIASGTTLTKNGAGDLSLTGTSGSLTGQVNVTAGKLITNATVLAAPVVLSNSANVTFDQGTAGTYAQVISGTGSLTKQGAGVLTVNAASTYSGPTTISSGTLRLGLQTQTSTLFTDGNLGGSGNWSLNNSGSWNGDASLFGGQTSHSGADVIYIGNNGGGFASHTDANVFQPSTTYKFTIDVGTRSDVNGSSIQDRLQIGYGGTLLADSRVADLGYVAQTGWQDVTISYTTPASGAMIGQPIKIIYQRNPQGGGEYTGYWQTNIDDAELAVESAIPGNNLLPIGTTVTMSSNTTFDINGANQQIACLSDAGATGHQVLLGNGNLTVGDGTDFSFSGAISGTDGTLTKTGAGKMTLAGLNTHTGTTAINQGTLAVGNDTALGATGPSGAILKFDGGTFQPTAAITSSRPVVVAAGGGTFDTNGFNSTFSGPTSGAGTLTKNGAGDLSLTGTSGSLTGQVNVTAGKLITNATVLAAPVVLSNSANVTFDQGTAGTYAQVISGTGSLTKQGAGVLTVSAASTYDGPTLITGGTLKLQGEQTSTLFTDGNIADSGNWNVVNGGSIPWDPADYVTFFGGQTPHSGSPVLYLGNHQAGSATHTNANVFQPSTTYNFIIDVGTRSDVLGGSNLDRMQIGYGATLLADSAITDLGYVYQTGWQDVTLSYTTPASGAMIGQPIEIIYQRGASGNDYSGYFQTNIDDAELAVESVGGAVLPSNSAVSIALGATLDLNGTSQQVASLSDSSPGVGGSVINSTTGSTSVLTLSPTGGSTIFSGGIQGTSGGTQGDISLVKSGNGTQVLAGTNTYTGTTTISEGTLQLGDGGTTGSIPLISTITDNGTLAINRSNTATQGVDFGLISGTGGFIQAGSGTTIFNLANTYTGTTTVDAGTLVVNGTISGSTTVNSGVLGGTGAVGGVMVGGGTIAPGDPNSSGGIGDFTANGNVSFGSTSAFNIQFDSSEASKDLLNINGTLTISSGAVLNVTDIGTNPASLIGVTGVIIDYANGGWTSGNVFAGTSDDQTFIASSGFTYLISYDGAGGVSEVTLTLVSVPEPGAAVSLLGGLGLLLGVRRRRSA